MTARLLIAFLTFVPRHLVSQLAGWIAMRTIPAFLRGTVYSGFCRIFGASASEAEHPFSHYASINQFFTRALKPGLRQVSPGGLVCPVDGATGACGTVTNGTLIQAKGTTYSLEAMLTDAKLAAEMEGGTFATLYLAPKDYHRIHCPVTAKVLSATYVPGELWPVNRAAVAHVPGLFARNERIVVELRRENGAAFALVAVGATMVGMTRLAFDDLHTHARRRVVDKRVYNPPKPLLAGDALGHFEFGSTVVLVCSAKAGTLELSSDGPVRMGQPMGPVHD